MSGEFVKAGYLVKSPPDFKALVAQWHKRWFLLMDSKLVYPLAARYVRLEYYQNEQEAKRLADPKGVINLNTCTKVSSREPMKGHKHVFDVHTDERVYHLVAESGEDKQSWIDTLNTLLFTTQELQGPGRQRRWSPPQSRRDEDTVIRRAKNASLKQQRPLSFTGNPSPSPSSGHRPLPPVPNGVPSSKPPRQRPLPPTPSTTSPHDESRPLPPTRSEKPPSPHEEKSAVSPQVKKRKLPPPKPPPYRSHQSAPVPVDITGLYDVAPGRTSVIVHPSPVANRRILPLQIRSLDEDLGAEDYSVLTNANVLSADNDSDMYSHLSSTDTKLSKSPHSRVSLPDRLPQSRGVHNCIAQTDEDYSLLRH